jgi:ABC-type transporter Mla subunit MlaD
MNILNNLFEVQTATKKTWRGTMKQLLIMLASLALFACGGSDSGGSASDAADSAVEAAEEAADSAGNAIDEAAAAMHGAIDKAEGVGQVLEDNKDAIDEALDDAEEAVKE